MRPAATGMRCAALRCRTVLAHYMRMGRYEPSATHDSRDGVKRTSSDVRRDGRAACRYYARGHCRDGDRCRFRHGQADSNDDSAPPRGSSPPRQRSGPGAPGVPGVPAEVRVNHDGPSRGSSAPALHDPHGRSPHDQGPRFKDAPTSGGREPLHGDSSSSRQLSRGSFRSHDSPNLSRDRDHFQASRDGFDSEHSHSKKARMPLPLPLPLPPPVLPRPS
jgi:hypothetical protein